MNELANLLAAFLDLPMPIGIIFVVAPMLAVSGLCLWVARIFYGRGCRDCQNQFFSFRDKYDATDRTIRL